MVAGGTYLFGRLRVSGRDADHRSYRSFASFHDPDGNGWLLQEITTGLPGRVAGDTTYALAADLSQALQPWQSRIWLSICATA